MSGDTGLFPSNGHRIMGRTTESFIDARDVISRLDLKGNEVFMDVGCGDGHVSMIAQDMLDDDATIYALDVYQPSIEDMEKDVKAHKITNVVPIQADVIKGTGLEDNIIDICLLINVFHHFVSQKKVDEAIDELKRIIKPGGRIAVMDYKKVDTGYGPPLKFKSSSEEMEGFFAKHDLKRVKLDTEVGEILDDGTKSHYLIIFQK